MNSISLIKRVSKGFLDLLWPPFCAICGGRTKSGPVCERCSAAMTKIGEKFCPECGSPITGDFCSRHRDAVYPQFLPAFDFGDRVRELIHKLKYSGRRDIGRFFGDIILGLEQADPIWGRIDGLLPVPLHKLRMRDRGYNQSEIIAEPISKATGIPMFSKSIKRVRNTSSQTKLNAKERENNIAGAFMVSERLTGKKLAIIDDVITTGATTKELASAIKQAGGEVVCAMCVARPGFEN